MKMQRDILEHTEAVCIADLLLLIIEGYTQHEKEPFITYDVWNNSTKERGVREIRIRVKLNFDSYNNPPVEYRPVFKLIKNELTTFIEINRLECSVNIHEYRVLAVSILYRSDSKLTLPVSPVSDFYKWLTRHHSKEVMETRRTLLKNFRVR